MSPGRTSAMISPSDTLCDRPLFRRGAPTGNHPHEQPDMWYLDSPTIRPPSAFVEFRMRSHVNG